MPDPQTDQVSAELGRISDWPAEDRLELARKILQTLESRVGEKQKRQASLRNLLGMLDSGNPPPSDEECGKVLEEELLRKHGS